MYFELIFKFLKTYWKPIFLILIVAGSFAFGYFKSKDHWQAPLLSQIQKYQIAQREYNAKIDAISQKAQEDSKELTSKIESANSTIDDLSAKYEQLKKVKQKVIYSVKDPRNDQKQLNLEFDTDGSLICNKFSSAYLDTINQMIKEANK